MEFVDTHCHLQFEAYKGREDAVLAEASKAGVKKIICPGTSLEYSKLALELAHSKDNVWAAVGVHPHDADDFLKDVNAENKLKKMAQMPKVIAMGETGLDFYKLKSDKSAQEEVLRTHLALGQKLGLPIIFHVRDAWRNFWKVFDSYNGLTGVIHSFTGGPKQLEQTLSRQLYIALNGIITYTKDRALLEAARAAPMDRLVLETDAPFLTPNPYRGQICEPKHTLQTAKFLANLRNQPLEELAAATTANAVKLFNLGEDHPWKKTGKI